MGDAADVPIEPIEQTSVLDETMALPGVIGGGVPGGESRVFLVNTLLMVVSGGL
jgi:phosphomevalonate kinase